MVDAGDYLGVGCVIADLIGNLRHHVGGGGKTWIIRVDASREGGLRLRHPRQLVVRIILPGGLPDGPALLQQPHSGDVLEEAGGAFDAAFVGKVEAGAFLINYRRRHLDPHQAPGTAAQVGELPVRCGYGGNCGGGVVPGYGYDGYGSEAEFSLQHSHLRARRHHREQHIGTYAGLFQQCFVELTGGLVHHAGSGGVGVFADHLSGQQVRQQVRHEQYGPGVAQGGVVVQSLCVQLEDGVEVHYLDAGAGVEPFPGNFCEEFFRDAVGIRVPVAAGEPQKRAVPPYAAEVHTPGVYADGVEAYPLAVQLSDAFDKVAVHGVYVPVETAVAAQHFGREAVHLLHRETSVGERRQHPAARRRTAVKCQKAVAVFHFLPISFTHSSEAAS